MISTDFSKKERAFFNAARSLAELSDHRCKLGCVVVDGHKIVSSGYNSARRCHRMQAELDQRYFGMESKGPIHSELDALLPFTKPGRSLAKATLYVWRELPTGAPGMARPCARCMSLIKALNIRRVCCSTPDGAARELITEFTQ